MSGNFTSLNASGNANISGSTTCNVINATGISATSLSANNLYCASIIPTSINTSTIDSINPSDNVSLYQTNTGTITLGNSSSINNIVLNNNIVSSKKLTISNENVTGLLETNDIAPSILANDVNLYRASTGKITIGNTSNTNNITMYQPLSLSTLKLFGENIYISSINGNAMTLYCQDVCVIRNATQTFANVSNLGIELSNSSQSVKSNNIAAFSNSSDVNLYTGVTTSNFNIGNVSNTNNININQNLRVKNTVAIDNNSLSLIASNQTIKTNIIEGINSDDVALYNTHTGNISLGNSTNTNPITCNQNFVQTNTNIFMNVQNLQAVNGNTEVKFYTNVNNSIITMGSPGNASPFNFQQILSIPRAPLLAYTTLPTYQANEIGEIKYFTTTTPNFNIPNSYASGSLSLPIGIWAINYTSSITSVGASVSTLTRISTYLSVNSTSPYSDNGIVVAQQIPMNAPFNASVAPSYLSGSHILRNSIVQTFQIVCNLQYTGSQTGNLSISGSATRIA